MQMQIQLLAPAVAQTKSGKGGKSYQSTEVAYKDLREGKIAGKKLIDFNNREVFAAVLKAVPGVTYNVTLEKGEEYWNWVAFEEALSEPASPAGFPASSRPAAVSPASNVTRVSNYETPEERQQRQRYIIRQTNVRDAIDILKHNSPKSTVQLGEIFNLASQLENYVYNGLDQPKAAGPVDPADTFADMKDDLVF